MRHVTQTVDTDDRMVFVSDDTPAMTATFESRSVDDGDSTWFLVFEIQDAGEPRTLEWRCLFDPGSDAMQSFAFSLLDKDKVTDDDRRMSALILDFRRALMRDIEELTDEQIDAYDAELEEEEEEEYGYTDEDIEGMSREELIEYIFSMREGA